MPEEIGKDVPGRREVPFPHPPFNKKRVNDAFYFVAGLHDRYTRKFIF